MGGCEVSVRRQGGVVGADDEAADVVVAGTQHDELSQSRGHVWRGTGACAGRQSRTRQSGYTSCAQQPRVWLPHRYRNMCLLLPPPLHLLPQLLRQPLLLLGWSPCRLHRLSRSAPSCTAVT